MLAGEHVTLTEVIVGEDPPPLQPASIMQLTSEARFTKFGRTRQTILLRTWPIKATPLLKEC
jgi:hypothetical protein